MTYETCDGCGADVEIAGATENLWTFDESTTGGLTLELVDGTEHFLCYDCIEQLPDDHDVTAEDVATLSSE